MSAGADLGSSVNGQAGLWVGACCVGSLETVLGTTLDDAVLGATLHIDVPGAAVCKDK